jgi:hypothetical protein
VDVHPSWQAFLEFYQAQSGPKQLVGYSKLARQHYASDGLYSGTATWLMCAAAAAAELDCRPDGKGRLLLVLHTYMYVCCLRHGIVAH